MRHIIPIAFALVLLLTLLGLWVLSPGPDLSFSTEATVADVLPAKAGQAVVSVRGESKRLEEIPAAPTLKHATTKKPLGPTRPAIKTTTPPFAPDQTPEPKATPEPAMRYSVDKDGISTAISDRKHEIRACYEAWLKSGAQLRGRLTVRLTIDTPEVEGAPAQITTAALVDSELDHPFMEGCVLNIMRELQFDAPPKGEVTVNYPFDFSDRDEP